MQVFSRWLYESGFSETHFKPHRDALQPDAGAVLLVSLALKLASFLDGAAIGFLASSLVCTRTWS